MGSPEVSLGTFMDGKWIKANELFDWKTAKYCEFLGNICGKYYLITWEERIYKKTSTWVLQTIVNNHKQLKIQGFC